ncbi:MAG: glycoside hydrolase family 28 protein [Limisphaerales bacterium]
MRFAFLMPLHSRRILFLTMLVLPGVAWAGGGTFNVRQYGAFGDGTNMDTAALQKTIDAAADAGGGIVIFPPGRYLSGSLDLKSHVTVQMDGGATLLGSSRRLDYHKVNFHGLLLADRQRDIAICGKGMIDGQGTLLAADTERLWKEGRLPDAKEGQRPVLINFRDCTNVTVRDITLKDSACWVEDYRDCEHLTLENLTVRSIAALNNDGIDVDGCAHVVVRGCDIDSEDDGICLKSGDKACDDVLVENCRVRSSCNALKFGTASSVGFKNIICRNLEIYDTYISGIALEIVDGGEMENVRISHIRITNSSNAIFIRLGHRNVHGAVGSLHNVSLDDIAAEIPNRPPGQMNKFPGANPYHSPTLITASITGLPGHSVRDVTLKNITIVYGGIGSAPLTNHLRWDSLATVPECAKNYPESRMFGILPAWGFYCRHASGIRFDNITLRVQEKDYRPALVCDDVRDIALNGFHVGSAGSDPVMVFNDVQGASIRDSLAPPGTCSFVKTTGSTRDVQGTLKRVSKSAHRRAV